MGLCLPNTTQLFLLPERLSRLKVSSRSVDRSLSMTNADAPILPASDTSSESEVLRQRIADQDSTIFEMRTLLESGKGLSNIRQLVPLLETCMAIVRERYGCKTSSVLLKDDLDPGRELFVVKAFHGLEEEYVDAQGRRVPLLMFPLPKDRGLLWQILMQGKVMSVRDLKGDPRFKVAFAKWHLDVLDADVWCPLIKGGEVLGILTLGASDEGPIAPSEFRFLQEFASIASTSIDSTLKYEKNERILKNIRTLYDVNQQLNNVSDFKKLCRETLAKALDAVNAQKGNLMLVNPETGQLEVKVVWGMIPDHVRDGINSGVIEVRSIPIGEGIAGRCAATLKPIRVNDPEKIPQISQFEALAMSCVPIVSAGRIEGVMTFTNKVRRNLEGHIELDPLGRFTEEDLSLLESLADQAGTGLKKARLYSDSITDRMTGLYNTRHYEEIFAAEFAASLVSKQPMCLGILDIDFFKKFNDTNGHKAGDAVLQQVARMFAARCRPGTDDMVFRYGGEEYCMILPRTTPHEAAAVLDSFRAEMAATPLMYEGKELKISVSIGIAASLLDTSEPKDLFKLADECLYAAKQGGRNQVRVYGGGAKSRVEEVSSISGVRSLDGNAVDVVETLVASAK